MYRVLGDGDLRMKNVLIQIYRWNKHRVKVKKGKTIPVTGRGGPWGSDVEAPTFSRQSAHRWRRSWQPLHSRSAAGRITSIKKSSDFIGNRTRDLPACTIVPQPTTLPCAPKRGRRYEIWGFHCSANVDCGLRRHGVEQSGRVSNSVSEGPTAFILTWTERQEFPRNVCNCLQ
jgi:hypothetical protein